MVLAFVERQGDDATAGPNGMKEDILNPPPADQTSSAIDKCIQAFGVPERQLGGKHLFRFGIPKSAIPPSLKVKLHPDAVGFRRWTVLTISFPS